MKVGEIYIGFNPIRKWGQLYMCEQLNYRVECRPGVVSHKLIPIDITKKATIMDVANNPEASCSGSPIINLEGKLVGMYGLGLIERNNGLIQEAVLSPNDKISTIFNKFFKTRADIFH